MQSSKGYALLFLIAAFLAGAALGYTADRMLNAERHGELRGPRAYRQKMARELGFTARQQAAVDSLFDARHRQIMALYRPIRPQLDSIAVAARAVSDSTHAQIAALLDSRQRAKFEKMRSAARKHLAERRRGESTGYYSPKLPR